MSWESILPINRFERLGPTWWLLSTGRVPASGCRYVVSWEVSETLEQPFVTRAVERALKGASPAIFNSDQGSHFTSPQYTKLVEAAGSKVSTDGKGRAIDNIFTERLWCSTKWENVYLADYRNVTEAEAGLRDYFDFYNNRRPHQSLNYRTPSRVYFG